MATSDDGPAGRRALTWKLNGALDRGLYLRFNADVARRVNSDEKRAIFRVNREMRDPGRCRTRPSWRSFARQPRRTRLGGPFGQHSLHARHRRRSFELPRAPLQAGSAFANDKYEINSLTASRSNETRWGWMVGAGIEYSFSDNWSAKIEYNYLDFGIRTLKKRENFIWTSGTTFSVSTIMAHHRTSRPGRRH